MVPGDVDSDDAILDDASRPLVFYSMALGETLKLAKTAADTIRIVY